MQKGVQYSSDVSTYTGILVVHHLFKKAGRATIQKECHPKLLQNKYILVVKIPNSYRLENFQLCGLTQNLGKLRYHVMHLFKMNIAVRFCSRH